MSFDSEKIKALKSAAELLHSFDEVSESIKMCAQNINRDYQDLCPLVITIMNGGLVFAGQLLPELDFPLQIDYMHATRYGDETIGKELVWKVMPQQHLAGRHILLIDDILDEGHTLWHVMKYCRQQKAASVKIAVLLDKVHDRKYKKDFVGDYTCLRVEDKFLFGCGLDYLGYWRNAPGIYSVHESTEG